MKKVDTTVGDLVAMIERGELLLPEMQRRYVWRASRVRDLFDSLYRGYPSGTILVWESDQGSPVQDMAVEQARTPFAGCKLLLDGQQRLTSLYSVIKGQPVTVRGRRRPIEILFNLDHPEGSPLDATDDVEDDDEHDDLDGGDDEENGEESESPSARASIQERLSQLTFVVGTKALARKPNWVSVSEVFGSSSDTEILKGTGMSGWEDPRYAKYAERLQKLRRIRDYPYVMQVLGRDLDYTEVTEIFVRVNSLGMKLRGSDLALAQITAKWRNSLPIFEAFREECERQGFSIDLGNIVRAMVIFATHQSRFKTVGGISLDRLKLGWEKAKDGLQFATNFLRQNADIEDESLLSSPFLIMPVAVLSELRDGRLSQAEEADLRRWLLVANAKGRYSGSAETKLDDELRVLFGKGSASDLLRILEQQFVRLEVTPDDLEGRAKRSPLFATSFLALRQTDAKDWHSGLGISLSLRGKSHLVQYHHVFPRAVLTKAGYPRREINEIANMAFISGKTNRRISAKPPTEYFRTIIDERGEEALSSQAIPLDKSLWEIDRYPDFLAERRRLLAKRINELLAAKAGKAVRGT